MSYYVLHCQKGSHIEHNGLYVDAEAAYWFSCILGATLMKILSYSVMHSHFSKKAVFRIQKTLHRTGLKKGFI